MAASSTQGFNALAPTQGNTALAPTQGNDAITIVTYNMGVRQKTAMSSQGKKRTFQEKLKQDVAKITKIADVICCQELNNFWRAAMDDLLPGWQRNSNDKMTVSTYVRKGLFIKHRAEHHVFPESTGKKKLRMVVQTVIGRDKELPIEEQQTWNVWNNHTVSGEGDWAISGDIGKFCGRSITSVMRKALASAQGNTKQCVVLCGDWNYFKKTGFGNILRSMSGVPDAEFCGEHRDFIVSCFASQEEVGSSGLVAWDDQHAAVAARIHALAPAQGKDSLSCTSAEHQASSDAQALMAQIEANQRDEEERKH